MSKKRNTLPVSQVDPLAGKPRTEWIEDETGNPALLIHAREITPLREKWARGLATFSAIALSLTGPLVVAGMHNAGALGTGGEPPGGLLLGLIIGPWIFRPVMRMSFRAFLKKTQKIMVTLDSVRVLRKGRWHALERSLIEKIDPLSHDNVVEEEDRLQLRRSEGKLIFKKRFYTQSFHIVAWHLGQRFDLLEVFGEKAALRVAGRISACIAFMDTLRKHAAQLPVLPANEQSLEQVTGQIPEHVPGQIPEEV